MEARFDASSTAAVQDFMEEAGFPIPEANTDAVNMSEPASALPEPDQKRIDLFFKPRATTDSDEDVEHDWEYHATWRRDAAGAPQISRCITPSDDVTVEGSNATWANSVLAQMITGPPPIAGPTAELSAEAIQMRGYLRVLTPEISPPVQRHNGRALQARVQPTRS